MSGRPLIPRYQNEKRRINEHQERLYRAWAQYDGRPICPDCYLPPEKCTHLRRKP